MALSFSVYHVGFLPVSRGLLVYLQQRPHFSLWNVLLVPAKAFLSLKGVQYACSYESQLPLRSAQGF